MFFRNPIMRRLNLGAAGAPDIDNMSNETCSVLSSMPPGGNGRVEMRGTTWSARNVGATVLSSGARCTVVRSDKLTLLVKAEEVLP